MLFVTTCCIYKSISNIYLFNNCKEKCTFSTRLWVLRDQISQEILVEIIIFLCLSKIYLSSFTWSKLHSKNQDEAVSIRSWIFHILAILLRTSQVNNVWVLKLLWPGKPALLVWQRNYHVETQFHLQKILSYIYCDLWKLFYSKWTEIIIQFWLANVLFLLSDYRKEEIIQSMNLINPILPGLFWSFSAPGRGCLIPPPVIPLSDLQSTWNLAHQ